MFLECCERFFADMVFDAFGVTLGRYLVNPEALQKRDHDPVASAAGLSECLASFGQEYRAIFFSAHQPCLLQARDILGHCWGFDPQPFRDVDRSRLAVGFNQFRDQFHIVFRHLTFMRIAHMREPVGLGFGIAGIRRKIFTRL